MINCLIIDDEQHCIDTLAAMIKARFSAKVSVIGSTTDSRKAAEMIAQHQPDVLFIDVEMPHINGIQIVDAVANRNFAVIFTTAYDRYALQALKTEAVDYLLKPISLAELGEAIDKASQRLQFLRSDGQKKDQPLPQKLLLPTSKGLLAANIPNIIRVEADSNYCNFYIDGKPKVVVAKTLKEYEEILTPCDFFRVHQSHLINLHYVEYFHPGLEEYVILTNGEQIEVSRRRKAEFLQKLASL
ncbi:MAG: LytTR family DNA-binding domain-containing protein [Dyadobacter sp.]|uniref:LytR/AlgR family response regulator transcription factor n=1 Tax=Dyadobacter sp. TaxID=1914288 RepID=UPI0032643B24